jgi:hypothetical protein
MKLPQTVIDEILERVSIVELVGRYQKIERNGTEALALCPFHADKNPSLSISDEKGLYNCFACGASGNAATFLMNYKKIDFREAMQELADIAKIDITQYDKKDVGYNPTQPQVKRPKDFQFIRKLRTNLEALGEIDSSYCVSSYKSSDGKQAFWRDNYFPMVDNNGKTKKGNPAGAITQKQINYHQKQSQNHGKMISCGVSLFGTQTIQNKNTGNWNKSKAHANATHCLEVALDFDNMEWKANKDNIEYRNIDNKLKFLNESKERLLTSVKTRLTQIGLYDYATIVDTGSGFHVHFILDKIETYNDLDSVFEEGVFNIKEYHELLMEELVLKVGSDPAAIPRTFMFKWIPDTHYHKISPAQKVNIRKDAGAYLTFKELFDKVKTNRAKKDVDREFFIYEKATKLFESVGRAPDREFLDAVVATYPEKPKADDIAADFESYIQQGSLPNGEIKENEYNGQTNFEGGDGSAICITKNYLMKYRIKKMKKDSEGNETWEEEWITIPSSYALMPKYRIEDNEDPEGFSIVFDCIRAGEKRRITVEGKKFGSADSLQKALRAQQVDITLSNKSASAFYSYALKYSKKIRNSYVGANYQYDAEGKLTDSYVAGWDYILSDGKITKGDNGIIETGADAYYIRGYHMRKPNEHKRNFVKKNPDYFGKLEELRGKIDKIFMDKNVSRLYLSFLAVAIAREPLLDSFSGVPFLSLHGQSGCGKSTLLEVAQNMFNQQLLTSKPTVSTTIKSQKYRRNGVLLFDELDEHHLQTLMPFLKDSVTNAYRPRQDKEGNIISDDQILNTPIISTNLPIHYHGEAWDNRMVKIAFSKKMRKLDVDALADLRYFASKEGFALFIDLYERVKKIDFTALEEEIHAIEKDFIKIVPKDARLAQMYSMLLALGKKIGIIDCEYADIMPFIQSNETDRGSSEDILIGSLVACAADLTRENPRPEGTPQNIDGKEKYPDGQFIPEEFAISMARFTKYMDKEKVFQNVNQRAVRDLLYRLPFLKVKRGTKKMLFNKDWVNENGNLIYIDFSDEAFKDYFEARVECVKNFWLHGKYSSISSKYLWISSGKTDEGIEKTQEIPY